MKGSKARSLREDSSCFTAGWIVRKMDPERGVCEECSRGEECQIG